MGLLRNWRRNKTDRFPFPDHWRDILSDEIPQYVKMDAFKREKFEKKIRYFMEEKSFEGCGGMELDDKKKLLIAALACLPLMGDVSDLYPYLRSVLVYPSEYRAPYRESGVDGVVSEGVESRSGESWDQGVLVFSWDEIAYDLRHPTDGANIVFHECAHQLDYEWGATMESFAWQQKPGEPGMASVLKASYQNLLERLESGSPVRIDDYAATNIHEFFAVMTETWLERPERIRNDWPEVEKVLSDFYNFKPDFL